MAFRRSECMHYFVNKRGVFISASSCVVMQIRGLRTAHPFIYANRIVSFPASTVYRHTNPKRTKVKVYVRKLYESIYGTPPGLWEEVVREMRRVGYLKPVYGGYDARGWLCDILFEGDVDTCHLHHGNIARNYGGLEWKAMRTRGVSIDTLFTPYERAAYINMRNLENTINSRRLYSGKSLAGASDLSHSRGYKRKVSAETIRLIQAAKHAEEELKELVQGMKDGSTLRKVHKYSGQDDTEPVGASSACMHSYPPSTVVIGTRVQKPDTPRYVEDDTITPYHIQSVSAIYGPSLDDTTYYIYGPHRYNTLQVRFEDLLASPFFTDSV